MSKTIQINPDSKLYFLPLDELRFFQGELKELTEVAFHKLRKEILETGFNFAYHAWKNPENNHWYILDGHQRKRVLTKMRDDEGFNVPNLPVVRVMAKNYKAAATRWMC